ncbi:hypothetical protein BU23DRAFT_571482 [Bimuria novae-zelandiae CBS 107.79]|uniref:Uncharacterized protein n=1 Tax=Bimuria novae-zelandiae CBS 107.79 TaxID=1447943 RepID=A0A6A5UXV1_9PLEO|nr:hypothetical protein BU23DRAFT_571482 [Bimuria novae-zelandiae CBS 107.79]
MASTASRFACTALSYPGGSPPSAELASEQCIWLQDAIGVPCQSASSAALDNAAPNPPPSPPLPQPGPQPSQQPPTTPSCDIIGKHSSCSASYLPRSTVPSLPPSPSSSSTVVGASPLYPMPSLRSKTKQLSEGLAGRRKDKKRRGDTSTTIVHYPLLYPGLADRSRPNTDLVHAILLGTESSSTTHTPENSRTPQCCFTKKTLSSRVCRGSAFGLAPRLPERTRKLSKLARRIMWSDRTDHNTLQRAQKRRRWHPTRGSIRTPHTHSQQVDQSPTEVVGRIFHQ